MEEKILKTIVTMSIENIINELRKFSPEPLNCEIKIVTRDEDDTDTYLVTVENCEGGEIFSQCMQVFHSFDPKVGEGIREVIDRK